MRVHLTTADSQDVEYSPAHGFGPAREIPCFRCGICCIKWQPPIDVKQAKKIAAGLGLSYRTFLRQYTIKYPMKDGYLIRRDNGQCVFLKFENGRAGCAIHDYEPEACFNWKAGLEKPECQEGLRRSQGTGALALPSDLNLTGEDLAALYEVLKQ